MSLFGPYRAIFELGLDLKTYSFRGPNGLFLGLGSGSTTDLGSTYVVEQLSFSLFLSILTFNFDLILGSFFIFGALTGYFWGWGRVQTLFLGLLMDFNNFIFLCYLRF